MAENEFFMEKNYTLTDIQAGMFFETLCSDYASPVYISQMLFSIHDVIDVSLFLQAFSVVLERHEVLRSGIHFDSKQQSFTQFIPDQIEMPHVFFDYVRMDEAKKLESFRAFLEEDIHHAFVLETPPLMRLAFFKLDNKNYRIVWTRHHILMGGASVKAVINEWLIVYKELLNSEKHFLAEAACYGKIYNPQESCNLSEAKQFWQKYLCSFAEAVSLPALLKGEKKTKEIKSHDCELNKAEYKRLRTFVDQNDLTINTLLEAAWSIVLANYTGKQKVIFGSVRECPQEALRNAVGLFINILPIQLNLAADTKILPYLKSIRKKNKILKNYITTPLSKIKEWLSLSPDVLLYQSVIDYKPYSLTALIKTFFTDADCSVSLNLNIPYPLTLEVIKEEDSLSIRLNYDVTLFEETYAHSILLYFKQTLNELITCQAESTLLDISSLLNQDVELINVWNNTSLDYPKNKTIHQVFEEQVKKTPSANALVYKDQSLSYSELNQRVNQFAHHLIERGIQLEATVAVFMKPGMAMIVAVLSILKSGGAYLPVDCAYPENRIQYLLKDSRAKIVIADLACIHVLNHMKDNDPELDFSVINMNEFIFSDSLVANPSIPAQAGNLMYITYTSGSTGKPKGVMVEHRSALNMALSCISLFKVNNQSRILQISSFSFDVFVAEWCMALLSGACLYLMDKEVFSPDCIADLLRKYKITTIVLSSLILSVLPKVTLPYLKIIAFGGESSAESVVSFWAKNRLFLNIYGITEAAVCSTVSSYSADQGNRAIIGKPLPNTQVHVLSENQAILPVGVPGELYIGGDGVARGYFNNLEMTTHQFISLGLETDQKHRLYKTGDRGRWLPSGELEFLGRLDEQVKIRGFRIELIEVERAIERHPGVSKTVILVSESSLHKRLDAYILLKNQYTNLDEIKQFVQRELPGHLIPGRFFQVKQFPLTPHGKVDKTKLLSLQSHELPRISLEQYPQLSLLEKNIVSIIQSILNIQDVPIHESFFDMGFDSISLVYFSVKLSERLGFKIDIVKLFVYPRVGDLVTYLTGDEKGADGLKNKTHTQKKLKKKKVQFFDE